LSPLKRQKNVDLVIFCENTEDVYAGIEWKVYSREARRFRELLRKEFGVEIRIGAEVEYIRPGGIPRYALKEPS